MPRALLSVYDKTDIVSFAETLLAMGWDVVASGGTRGVLSAAGLPVTPVEQLTGVPEMLHGQLKTLHPAIYGGILTTDRLADLTELERAGYAPINMVVCNLSPFRETAAQVGISLQDALAQIDVGGVTLLRAAATNFFHVVPVSDRSDYARVGAALKAGGQVELAMRRELAVKAFAYTRDYDTAIHAFLSQDTVITLTPFDLPEHISLALHRVETLRHGTNSHQIGAYYSRLALDAPMGGKIISEETSLTYNNLVDVDTAWRAVSSFEAPTVAVAKHGMPVGIACGDSLAAACPNAVACDPMAASGSVIAANRAVDEAFVEALGALLLEVIVAPLFTDGAQTLLRENRKNCRLIANPQPYTGAEMDLRSVFTGVLIQTVDVGDPEGVKWRTVSKRAPTADELASLQFAWCAVQQVRSSAIVLAVEETTVGIGGGLANRMDAIRLAIAKADGRAQGSVLASESFLASTETIEAAAAAGITAIIQPGGALRDSAVIAAADSANIAMVFTGVRHLRH